MRERTDRCPARLPISSGREALDAQTSVAAPSIVRMCEVMWETDVAYGT